MDLDVEVGALRSDAKAWDEAAQSLSQPTTAISPLTLDINDLTPLPLDDAMGLKTTYEKARANAQSLMTQAAKYFDLIGSALIAVAAEYEGTEQTRARRFRRHESELGDDR
jgi:hypothetical protein